MTMTQPGASASTSPEPATSAVDGFLFTPLPGAFVPPASKSSSTLTPLVCDERAIAGLLAILLAKAGLSVGEASRRLGITSNGVRQYLHGRRSKPSLIWFLKFCEMCGARVVVEFPERGR